MTRVNPAIAVVVSILAAGRAARAQSAEAEVLFREGRKLIKEGKVVAGCDKLQASDRLESSIGTLLNLGDCRERLGKVASAWAAFRKAEGMAEIARDNRREREARRRAARLEPHLPRLVVQVDRELDGLVVRRDDAVVDPASWNMALPTDPGTHTLIAEAPGHLAWRATITITPRSRRHVVTVPPLQRAPAPVVATTTGTAPPQPVAIVTTRRRGTWTGTRKTAVFLGVLGAGAAGTGVYFGFRARDREHRADLLCPSATCDNVAALALNADARRDASTANILYAAGGVAGATALILWLAGGPGDETVIAPAVGRDGAGVSLVGRF